MGASESMAIVLALKNLKSYIYEYNSIDSLFTETVKKTFQHLILNSKSKSVIIFDSRRYYLAYTHEKT